MNTSNAFNPAYYQDYWNQQNAMVLAAQAQPQPQVPKLLPGQTGMLPPPIIPRKRGRPPARSSNTYPTTSASATGKSVAGHVRRGVRLITLFLFEENTIGDRTTHLYLFSFSFCRAWKNLSKRHRRSCLRRLRRRQRQRQIKDTSSPRSRLRTTSKPLATITVRELLHVRCLSRIWMSPPVRITAALWGIDTATRSYKERI